MGFSESSDSDSKHNVNSKHVDSDDDTNDSKSTELSGSHINQKLDMIPQNSYQSDSEKSFKSDVSGSLDSKKKLDSGENSETESVNNIEIPVSLDGYIQSKLCKTRKVLKCSKPYPVTDISSDEDEVFLIQCPQDFNMKNVLNKKLQLNGKSEIRTKNNTYKLAVEKFSNKKKITLLSKNKISKAAKVIPINPSGRIIISESLSEEKYIPIHTKSTLDKDRVKYPKNLKTRHPLLGYQYKQLLEIPSDAAKKLKDTFSPRKVKRENKEISLSQGRGDDSTSSQNQSPTKRKSHKVFIETPISKKIKAELDNDEDLTWLTQI